MSTVAESATPQTASNRFSGAQHRLFAFSGLIVLMRVLLAGLAEFHADRRT